MAFGFPGMTPPGGAGGASDQEQYMIKMMQTGMESCPVKVVMAGGAGFVLGGAMGLFLSSMSYDTGMSLQSQQIANLPVREQVKRGLKDMGTKSYSSAKNFAMIGAMFSGVECCVEGFRAKNDVTNGVAAGCITGGILGAKAGPQAAAVGCVGFAAFSTAIEYYLRMPSEPAE